MTQLVAAGGVWLAWCGGRERCPSSGEKRATGWVHALWSWWSVTERPYPGGRCSCYEAPDVGQRSTDSAGVCSSWGSPAGSGGVFASGGSTMWGRRVVGFQFDSPAPQFEDSARSVRRDIHRLVSAGSYLFISQVALPVGRVDCW